MSSMSMSSQHQQQPPPPPQQLQLQLQPQEQWHPRNILLAFSLDSLAHPKQNSTSREHVRAWTVGIFDPPTSTTVTTLTTTSSSSTTTATASTATASTATATPHETDTPTFWECQAELDRLVKLRLAIHTQLRLPKHNVDLDFLYQTFAEYHASLKACEKHNLGLEWDSGGWYLTPDDKNHNNNNEDDDDDAGQQQQQEEQDGDEGRTTIRKERQFVSYNLGCLAVLRHLCQDVEEEDWSKQSKVFGTAATYFYHANLSQTKLKMCQAMQQRAMYEAASKQPRPNHLLLSKLAMATYESFPWPDDYFRMIAFYHDGKRLRKRKQHGAAAARFRDCWEYFQSSPFSSSEELQLDVQQELKLQPSLEDGFEERIIRADSLPSICGQSCRQKVHGPLPAYSTKSPQIFFSNLLPLELRQLHYQAKRKLQTWLEGWYCNEIQEMTETALHFIQELSSTTNMNMTATMSSNSNNNNNNEEESYIYHNELLVLMDQSQQCGEEVALLDKELQRERDRSNDIQSLVLLQNEDVLHSIQNLESQLEEKKTYLEQARRGDNVILKLLQNNHHQDGEDDLEDDHNTHYGNPHHPTKNHHTKNNNNNNNNNNNAYHQLNELLRVRQNVLFPSLQKQVQDFTLIPTFQELFTEEQDATNNFGQTQNPNLSWLAPYQQVTQESMDIIMGKYYNDDDLDLNQDDNPNYVIWSQKLRENMELQPILLQRMLQEDADRSSAHNTNGSNSKNIKNHRDPNIPEQLANGREFYQKFMEQLKQLREQILHLSTKLTVMEIEHKEQSETIANRERQEMEDAEYARIFAEQQQQPIDPQSSRSDEEDIAAILTAIENENMIMGSASMRDSTTSNSHSHSNPTTMGPSSSSHHTMRDTNAMEPGTSHTSMGDNLDNGMSPQFSPGPTINSPVLQPSFNINNNNNIVINNNNNSNNDNNNNINNNTTAGSNYHLTHPVLPMPTMTRSVSRSSHGNTPQQRRLSYQSISSYDDDDECDGSPLQQQQHQTNINFRGHSDTVPSRDGLLEDDLIESTAQSLTIEDDVDANNLTSTAAAAAAAAANTTNVANSAATGMNYQNPSLNMNDNSSAMPRNILRNSGNGRPGVVHVNYYELPQTQVDDEKVASLVAMDFDAEAAYAALRRHDNNMEQALNELLQGE